MLVAQHSLSPCRSPTRMSQPVSQASSKATRRSASCPSTGHPLPHRRMHYDIIPGYGSTLSGATLFPVTISTQSHPSSPKLTYNIFPFTTTTASTTVHLETSMNIDHSPPRIRYFHRCETDDGSIRTDR